jgi:hypothetical protein
MALSGLDTDAVAEHKKPSGKRKAKRNFTDSVKTPKGTEEKATSKGTTGMLRLRGSVSVNRMRAGHISLKASLN